MEVNDFDIIRIVKFHTVEMFEDRTIKESELLHDIMCDASEVVFETKNYSEAIKKFSTLKSDVINIVRSGSDTITLDIIAYEFEVWKEDDLVCTEKAKFCCSEYALV